MTWQKVSDDLWRHRKLGAITTDKLLPCVGLWALALAWTGANLTDGYVPRRALMQVCGIDAEDLADELVRVGLWERWAEGYVFHDYLEYNPSQNEVLTARAVHKEVSRAGGKARAAKARRTHTGQFTSRTAGLAAGVTPSPVSRIPSPVIPVPDSHKAAAGTAALMGRQRDAIEEGAA